MQLNYWLKEGVSLFRFYRLRLILSLISITVGIGAVCALSSINHIVALNSEKVLSQFGQVPFIATVVPRTGIQKKKAAQSLGAKQMFSFCNKHDNKISIIPYQIASHEKKKLIVGTLSGFDQHLGWPLASGRRLHRLDEQSKVAIVGQGVQAKLKSLISISGNYVEVVGILGNIEPSPLLDFDPNYAIFIGIELLARLKPFPWVDSFIVQTRQMPLLAAEQHFTRMLNAELGNIEIFIRDAKVFQLALLKQVNMTIQMLKMIALTTLLLGALSIVNLLVILVDERKKEIGLRLAMGATAFDIGWLFLREITLLCSLGAALGIVFGHLAAYIIVMKLGLTYYFGWLSWWIGLPVSVAMGFISGILPIYFAAKCHPVKLLNA
jgi:putative ABC transport system permease protein